MGVDEGSRRAAAVASLRAYWWPALIVVTAVVVTAVLLTQSLGQRGSAWRPAGSDAPAGAMNFPRRAATPEPVLTAATDVCRHNTAPQLVVVSLDQQHMWLCNADQPFTQSPVTTGSVDRGDGTPLGTWQIQSRETDRFLTGPDYRIFVHYWLPFFGDFGFHDSPWQQFAYGDRRLYRIGGSRGCVHVPEPMMATLYNWADVGTTVTVLP